MDREELVRQGCVSQNRNNDIIMKRKLQKIWPPSLSAGEMPKTSYSLLNGGKNREGKVINIKLYFFFIFEIFLDNIGAVANTVNGRF